MFLSHVDTFQARFLSKLDRSKRHRAGLPGEDEAPLPDPVQTIHGQPHPRRNEPCPCGSGKKFKKCCSAGK
ncbi:MAG: SEC-C domain-containing protein [Bacteroidetes bacterium]|nr:SEC-C domain-containing protein [Bacteroidota bacterium]